MLHSGRVTTIRRDDHDGNPYKVSGSDAWYSESEVERCLPGSSGLGRPTVGDFVRILNGPGAGTVTTIRVDERDSKPYRLEGQGSKWYHERDVERAQPGLLSCSDTMPNDGNDPLGIHRSTRSVDKHNSDGFKRIVGLEMEVARLPKDEASKLMYKCVDELTLRHCGDVFISIMASAADSPQMLNALAAVPNVVQTLLVLTRLHSQGRTSGSVEQLSAGLKAVLELKPALQRDFAQQSIHELPSGSATGSSFSTSAAKLGFYQTLVLSASEAQVDIADETASGIAMGLFSWYVACMLHCRVVLLCCMLVAYLLHIVLYACRRYIAGAFRSGSSRCSLRVGHVKR